MSNRHFHLRLNATYQGSENKIEDLTVEVLHENEWEPLDLNILSPGFLMFITALFNCQHLYMRANSAERDLILSSANGEMQVETTEDWKILDVLVSFSAKLNSGSPKDDDLDYITDRMRHCPVSTNLPQQVNFKNSVQFER